MLYTENSHMTWFESSRTSQRAQREEVACCSLSGKKSTSEDTSKHLGVVSAKHSCPMNAVECFFYAYVASNCGCPPAV